MRQVFNILSNSSEIMKITLGFGSNLNINKNFNKKIRWGLVLGLILFLEALGVVCQKMHARELNIKYYQLIAAQEALNTEWSQLLIEQQTWGSSVYIEQAAQDYLNMNFPKAQDVRIVDQN